MRFLLSIFLLLFYSAAFSQGVLPFRGDTIKIYKQGGSAELLLQNSTRNTTGVLVNIGGGKTQFAKPRKINDSTLVIGNDTIRGVGGGSGGGKTYYPGQGIIIENDSIKVNSASLPKDTTTFYKISAQVAGTGTIGFPLGIIGVQAYATAAALRLAPVNISTTYWRNIGGDIRPYRYDALDSTTTDDGVMVLAAPDGKRYKMLYTDVGGVDPYWWGAIPNDIVSDSAAWQAAILFAMNSPIIKRVYARHIGQYLADNLLILKYVSGQAVPVTLTIEGAMNGIGVGVSIKNTNRDGATFHIQLGYGVRIFNINFDGIGPDIPNFRVATDADWATVPVYNGGGNIRMNRKSPGQLAVSIDNFYAVGAQNSTIASSADYYPGLSAYYSNTNYNGSTGIEISGCPITRMYAGVMQGLSGIPNGEGIMVDGKGTQSIFVAHYFSAGQLQSRENIIQNVYLIFGHTFISNQWGTYAGDVPTVNNCNINYLKYAFETGGDFTIPRFNGGYQEGMYSLGKHTGTSPVIYDRVNVTMASYDYNNTPTGVAPVIAQTSGPFQMSNGIFKAGNYFSGLPFNVQQGEFNNVSFESGVPFNTNPGTYSDNLKFINCHQFEAGGNIRLDENRYGTALDDALFSNRNESFILPGGKVTMPDRRTFENVGEKYDKIYLGGLGVTVNSALQTATFTAPDAGLIKTGDVIYTNNIIDNTGDVYSASGTTLGYVSGKSGSTITLSSIPAGIVNGNGYDMYVLRLPRWVNHTLGNLISGTNSITGVVADAGSFVVGDRIKGAGIPAGAYVTNVSGSTITISTNATASGTNVELYDAKMKVTASSIPFSYFGITSYDNLEVIWFKGDEIKNLDSYAYNSGKYCVVPGKVLSASPPQFYSAINNQKFAIANELIGSNIYYDPVSATWKYYATGPGSALHFINGGFNLYTAVSGSAGATAPVSLKAQIDPSGSASLGGLWSYTGNFNGGMTSLSIPNVKYVDSLHGIWKNLQVANTRAAGYTGVNVARTDSLGMSASSDGGINEIWSIGRLNFKSTDDIHYTALNHKYHGSLTMVPVLSGATTNAATQVQSNPFIAQTQLWNGSTVVNKYSYIWDYPSSTANKKHDLVFVVDADGINDGTGKDAIRVDTGATTQLRYLRAGGNTPTVVAGAGAGTGAVVTIPTGGDMAFLLQVTTGTSPAAAGSVIATVTFAHPHPSGNFPLPLSTPMGVNGALGSAAGLFFYAFPTYMEVRATNTLAASTTYQFSIFTIGQQ